MANNKTPWWKFWAKDEDTGKEELAKEISQQAPKTIDDRVKPGALPSGRASVPEESPAGSIDLDGTYGLVNAQFIREVIPLIRKLSYHNPDVSQAVHSIVSLGNTGHKVNFDKKVSPEQVDKMRNHLVNKRKLWAPGQAGMDGLVNKMFAQLLISGALSFESVPNSILTGVESVLLVNAESIWFKLNERKTKYEPYQKVNLSFQNIKNPIEDLKKLNTNTYQYYALNGDEEIPYGIPPYLPVIGPIKRQKHMDASIDFIVDIVGLVGFLEVLIEAPTQTTSQSDDQYKAYLQGLINQAKANVMAGLKDGVVVGIKDSHTFKFNSASKSYEAVNELYKGNELQVASALKQDASLWGRDYGSSESTMGIVFLKMISELRNIQNIVKTALEFIYAMELRMAGFNFDFLSVQFNRSTIQDDLKYQQAEEIKVRNVKDKLILGLINQNDAADELGYEAPAFPQPQVDWEVLAGAGASPEPGLETDASKKKKDRKAGKNKSARTSRRKDKAYPKADKK